MNTKYTEKLQPKVLLGDRFAVEKISCNLNAESIYSVSKNVEERDLFTEPNTGEV